MRFAHAMSHDLNAPIKTTNCLLDLLSNEHKSQLDEDGVELLKMINTSARRLQDLIGGIAEHSGCLHPNIHYESVDTHELIVDLTATMRPAIHASRAQINLGTLPTIIGCRQSLNGIFSRLLDNALMYTCRETQAGFNEATPVISIDSSMCDDGTEFTMTDNGIGICPKDHDRVFHAFERVHARSSYEGAGLGLASCQVLVTALRGRIWMSSTEGSGSTVHVFCPNASASSPA